MKGRILTKETITGFINHLHLEEKSANTKGACHRV